MHEVIQRHERAWNSMLKCNGRRSPASNYRGSYSTGSYNDFMHHSIAQSRCWAEKGQLLAKTETCCELLVKSQLYTIPCIFIVPLISLAEVL